MTLKAACVLSLACALAGTTVIAPARAATYRVDDTGSLPRESTTLLNWRQVAPSRAADDMLEGSTAVAVRLNLAPWLNRSGRLFLVFPEQGAPLVRVSWRSQGRLLPGQILPGQRVLVYDGLIATPFLEETLALQIEASGDRLPGMQSLTFHFEIDVD